jgi:hypothetical protein
MHVHVDISDEDEGCGSSTASAPGRRRGDTDRVRDDLAPLGATGNGARRQRATRERTGDLTGVVDLVARTAESSR